MQSPTQTILVGWGYLNLVVPAPIEQRENTIVWCDRPLAMLPKPMVPDNSIALLPAVEAHGSIGLIPDFTATDGLASRRVVSVLPHWDMLEPYAGKIHAVYVSGRHVAIGLACFAGNFYILKYSTLKLNKHNEKTWTSRRHELSVCD